MHDIWLQVFTAYISDAPPAELPARAPSCTPTKAAQPPGLTSPAQPASKRQRREAAPLQNGPGQLSTDLSKSDPGAAAARPPDSPPSPPTPPSEPGEAEPDQDAVSDLSDSQNLYANTAAEPGDEAVSAAADDFLPFSPETPSESPERASSAGPLDEPAAAAPRPASAAPVAVPGLHNGPAPSRLLRSSRRQNTRSVPSSAQPLVTDTISASTGPGNQKGPASAEQRTGAAQRGSGSASGRELHSAYRQSGPVGELLRQRRLCLVLDLDHTLLNSAKFSEVDPDHLKVFGLHLQIAWWDKKSKIMSLRSAGHGLELNPCLPPVKISLLLTHVGQLLLIILNHSCTFYTGHTQEHRAACAHILPHVTLSILACCLTLTP